MASTVDICNVSLSHLGDIASITAIAPPDGSVQADHCARFYPIARNELLELHAWNFAVKRVALAEIEQDPTGAWGYRYGMPSNCLRALAVLAEDSDDGDDSKRYIIEAQDDGTVTILTDEPTATLRYIALVTDTTRFSTAFAMTLSWLLASYLAGPIIKGDSGAKLADYCYKRFRAQLAVATMADGAAHKPKEPDRTPTWIASR